ncbi:hypothetical protein D3C80_1688130 [compost metagenome]
MYKNQLHGKYFNSCSYIIRSDIGLITPKRDEIDFNPHSYIRSDAAVGGYGQDRPSHFNPRSYIRSDRIAEILYGSEVISIHAPT